MAMGCFYMVGGVLLNSLTMLTLSCKESLIIKKRRHNARVKTTKGLYFNICANKRYQLYTTDNRRFLITAAGSIIWR